MEYLNHDGLLPSDVWTRRLEGSFGDRGCVAWPWGHSHYSVTKEVSWLNVFVNLPTPIPLSITTKAVPAYLTEIWTMVICDSGGSPIGDEKTKGTLIWLDAPLKPGWHFYFQGDDLLIHSVSRVVKSIYHKDRWLLQRLRAQPRFPAYNIVVSAVNPYLEFFVVKNH